MPSDRKPRQITPSRRHRSGSRTATKAQFRALPPEGVSRFFGADIVPSLRQDRGLSFVSGWLRLDVATGGSGARLRGPPALPAPSLRASISLPAKTAAPLRFRLLSIDQERFMTRRPTIFGSVFDFSPCSQGGAGTVSPLQLRSIAKRFSTSSGTISRVASCVAVSLTLGALPASNASFQRSAQRHQQSPGSRPGKPNSCTGVERSLPAARENARNAASTFVHTVCNPKSSVPVLQLPSR